jgi:DNA polymerase
MHTNALTSFHEIVTDLTDYLLAQREAGLETLSPAEGGEIVGVLDSMLAGLTMRPQQSGSGVALASVREELGECVRCKLCKTRTTIVFGQGNPSADLMFVGEAPGRDEDRAGEPFVGEAGQLLTRIINAINLQREEVYIANVIKCRPPRNRDPESDEIEACFPFLEKQIEVVQPKVICALGRFAAQTLLGTKEMISRLRGKQFSFRNRILVPTYHPASLLRHPQWKRDVWEDVQRVQRILENSK